MSSKFEEPVVVLKEPFIPNKELIRETVNKTYNKSKMIRTTSQNSFTIYIMLRGERDDEIVEENIAQLYGIPHMPRVGDTISMEDIDYDMIVVDPIRWEICEGNAVAIYVTVAYKEEGF